MGLAVAVSNALGASWLKETFTLTMIRASRDSIRKAATSYASIQGDAIRKFMEAGDCSHFHDSRTDIKG